MLEFLLGVAVTWVFIALTVVVQKILDKRESAIRYRLIKESAELLAQKNKELEAKRKEILADMLKNPEVRRFYDYISNLIDRLIKREGIQIDIAPGISIQEAHEMLKAIIFSLESHLAEDQYIQKYLNDDKGSL